MLIIYLVDLLKGLFVSWITIIGAPQKIISDNGGVFCKIGSAPFDQ